MKLNDRSPFNPSFLVPLQVLTNHIFAILKIIFSFSTCQLRCDEDEGYYLDGPALITCTDTEQWDDMTSRCICSDQENVSLSSYRVSVLAIFCEKTQLFIFGRGQCISHSGKLEEVMERCT